MKRNLNNKQKFSVRVIYTILLVPLILWQCPHKPIDPGTLKNQITGTFSLPADLTNGQIKFKAQMYKTDGLQEIKTYNNTGYSNIEETFNVVGAEIQYVQVKQTDGTIKYKAKWVISGGRTKTDIENKKNIIIITILPDMDNEVPSKLECNNSSDVTAGNFCDNILSTGFFKTSTASQSFYSYEANKYSECTAGKEPYDFDNVVPIIDSDSSASNCDKEKAYGDTADSTKLKRFNVVVEFIDADQNVFTTKFPYNKDVDNLGNHTPVQLIVKNMPNPYLDPSTFTGSTLEANKTIYTDTSPPASGNVANCTSLQVGLTCDKVYNRIATTIANNTQTNGNRDDDIIHKMQQAGKEFRAAGTDNDPRFELIISDIYFKVERGKNRFITE